MKTRTSEERKRLHLLMFERMKETGCGKIEALGWMGMSDRPIHSCFACEEAGIPDKVVPMSDYCPNCPIVWGSEDEGEISAFCEKGKSPYKKILYNATHGTHGDINTQDRIEAATAILKLPFKEAWAETVVKDDRELAGLKKSDKVYTRTTSGLRITNILPGDLVEVVPVGVFTRDGKLTSACSLGQVLFARPQEEKKVEKKVSTVKKSITITGITWFEDRFFVPTAHDGGFDRFLNKPPMKMTLEWEEEEQV